MCWLKLAGVASQYGLQEHRCLEAGMYLSLSSANQGERLDWGGNLYYTKEVKSFWRRDNLLSLSFSCFIFSMSTFSYLCPESMF